MRRAIVISAVVGIALTAALVVYADGQQGQAPSVGTLPPMFAPQQTPSSTSAPTPAAGRVVTPTPAPAVASLPALSSITTASPTPSAIATPAPLPICAPGTHWSPGDPCQESPTAEWVDAAPYALAPAMVAATADMVTSLAPVAGWNPSEPAVDSFAQECQPDGETVITPSEFTWAWDTLYVDLNLDNDNPDQSYYQPWVEDWARALNDLRVECSNPQYQLSADEIATADHTTFQAEIAADIASFQSAEQIHAEWRASEGSSDAWDQEWADAYLELVALFQFFQP